MHPYLSLPQFFCAPICGSRKFFLVACCKKKQQQQQTNTQLQQQQYALWPTNLDRVRHLKINMVLRPQLTKAPAR